MEKHIQILALLYIGLHIIPPLVGIGLFALLAGIGVCVNDPTASPILTIVGAALGLLILLFSVPALVGGIGLWQRRRWARILLLILGVLHLPAVPFGTALGVYTLWVLMNGETVALLQGAA